MTTEQLSAMSMADDPRTFFLTAEIIDPQVGDEANLVLDSPWPFDVLETWSFSEGGNGHYKIEIDSDEVLFDNSDSNGVPITTGTKVKNDVDGTTFTVGVAGALVLTVELVDTGTTKFTVQVMCRRLTAPAVVT